MDKSRIAVALGRATGALLEARNEQGVWTGELSSSALSTATAVTALAIFDRANRSNKHAILISKGLEWLAENVNADGGWGDTIKSVSNLSTTTLCWAAFGAAESKAAPHDADRLHAVVEGAEAWISAKAGSIEPAQLVPAIMERYGKDRTFSAPILTMCALAGRLGDGRQAWKWVMSLPFELAALPRSWFGALHLPVVSYALPALIAIGRARHFHRPTRNPIGRFIRALTKGRTLRVLEQIQPANGGFLEATPLTSFVAMSLAGSGLANHVVTQRAIDFLQSSVRADGSWPIDTDLGTWVTTLSVNALSEPLNHGTPHPVALPSDGRRRTHRTATESRSLSSFIGMSGVPLSDEPEVALKPEERYCIQRWLLGQQYLEVHPYTDAAPGAWAWTDLPGGVPDADDTAGALLALHNLEWDPQRRMGEGIAEGIKWLLNVQNKDGGIPTFCRGWGALPFDRSSPDLTAHAVRAWITWLPHCEAELKASVEKAIQQAVAYLLKSRREDGSWIPLWFGNQFTQDDENPTYGTARVLAGLVDVIAFVSGAEGQARLLSRRQRGAVSGAISRATQWLLDAQDPEGGWGPVAPASVEETALAVHALARSARVVSDLQADDLQSALDRGTAWLIDRVENGSWIEPSPIGFYFAKLWYYEKIYPLAFTVAALRAVTKPQIGSR